MDEKDEKTFDKDRIDLQQILKDLELESAHPAKRDISQADIAAMFRNNPPKKRENND